MRTTNTAPGQRTEQTEPMFGMTLTDQPDPQHGALFGTALVVPDEDQADEQPVETVQCDDRDPHEPHGGYNATANGQPGGITMTPIHCPGVEKLRRNAKVTDNARALADFIDAHPDLGHVVALDAREYGAAKIQVFGPRRLDAMLSWFFRLASARTRIANGLLYVSGQADGVLVDVYTGLPDGLHIDLDENGDCAVTVHTLREWQIAGAR